MGNLVNSYYINILLAFLFFHVSMYGSEQTIKEVTVSLVRDSTGMDDCLSEAEKELTFSDSKKNLHAAHKELFKKHVLYKLTITNKSNKILYLHSAFAPMLSHDEIINMFAWYFKKDLLIGVIGTTIGNLAFSYLMKQAPISMLYMFDIYCLGILLFASRQLNRAKKVIAEAVYNIFITYPTIIKPGDSYSGYFFVKKRYLKKPLTIQLPIEDPDFTGNLEFKNLPKLVFDMVL